MLRSMCPQTIADFYIQECVQQKPLRRKPFHTPTTRHPFNGGSLAKVRSDQPEPSVPILCTPMIFGIFDNMPPYVYYVQNQNTNSSGKILHARPDISFCKSLIVVYTDYPRFIKLLIYLYTNDGRFYIQKYAQKTPLRRRSLHTPSHCILLIEVRSSLLRSSRPLCPNIMISYDIWNFH